MLTKTEDGEFLEETEDPKEIEKAKRENTLVEKTESVTKVKYYREDKETFESIKIFIKESS